jgi:hypothetical protein
MNSPAEENLAPNPLAPVTSRTLPESPSCSGDRRAAVPLCRCAAVPLCRCGECRPAHLRLLR